MPAYAPKGRLGIATQIMRANGWFLVAAGAVLGIGRFADVNLKLTDFNIWGTILLCILIAAFGVLHLRAVGSIWERERSGWELGLGVTVVGAALGLLAANESLHRDLGVLLTAAIVLATALDAASAILLWSARRDPPTSPA